MMMMVNNDVYIQAKYVVIIDFMNEHPNDSQFLITQLLKKIQTDSELIGYEKGFQEAVELDNKKSG
jgi:hypothetical protein